MRVQIIDILPLCYKYAYGGMPALSVVIKVDGVPQVVDTTIPTGVIKQIHRWSNFGSNPTVVCFDGIGSSRSRKAYFAKENGVSVGGEAVGYKSSRSSRDSKFYDGVNLTGSLLMQGGVCVMRADGYEADDLIKAAVDRAKQDYPGVPIDIITGDADLVPLVDDVVSVYLRSVKYTWAESKELERPHYVQITPANYQTHLEGLSAYKNLRVPYNTVLLAKLLRGDKSDEIPGYPKFTPTKYNKLVASLEDGGYDLSTICRYWDSVPDGNGGWKEPEELTELCRVLEGYLDEPVIEHVRFVYNGINLNGAYTGLGSFDRKPVRAKEIKTYSSGQLSQVVANLRINLPQD